MEHSALHALQLIGLIAALGGPVFMLALLEPAARASPVDSAFVRLLQTCQVRWAMRGALVAAAAAVADLFVQTAEVQGRTVFGGVPLRQVLLFVTQTTVGNLVLLRVALLLFVAAVLCWAHRAAGWLAAAGGIAALIVASLVSHAAAQPYDRAAAIAAQIAHVGAAAIWLGVLIHLLAARPIIESCTTRPRVEFIAEVVRRFSPVALGAATLLAASGAYTALRYFSKPSDVIASAYGLTLSVKLSLLAPLLVAAYTNFRLVRPQLLGAGRTDALAGTAQWTAVLRRFGRALELEVTAGLLIITVAGIVGSVSPPGPDDAQRLTTVQLTAMQHPVLPPTRLVDPASFVGATERTIDDLRYSELMHRWSGVFVIMMGLVWLGQSLGGAISAIAGRVWPLLLLPFAVFISIFADADVFLVPRLSFWDVVSDPAILEHQLGALMIVVLAVLGWRDATRPEAERPMGRALPLVMILGSLLLLGHAHSALSATEELTNLINVQHAVFGAFGLLAGTLRWLSLRRLMPPQWGNRAWPILIIGLGCFMAFCYRETI